jgi:hypothetical protein
MDMIFVKARPGEKIIDDQRRIITDTGGKVPANQFWLRRIGNGEAIIYATISKQTIVEETR